jgi:hypothetical protein
MNGRGRRPYKHAQLIKTFGVDYWSATFISEDWAHGGAPLQAARMCKDVALLRPAFSIFNFYCGQTLLFSPLHICEEWIECVGEREWEPVDK